MAADLSLMMIHAIDLPLKRFRMSTMMIAILLFALLTSPALLLVIYYKHLNRKITVKLLKGFSRLGSAHHLNFSGQDRLKNCIIGLDGIHCRLLVMVHDNAGKISHSRVIDLAEVKSCRCRKVYGVSRSLFLRRAKNYLEKIIVEFERSGKPRVEVLFYHHGSNKRSEVAGLCKKAMHWQSILTKMLPKKGRKTA